MYRPLLRLGFATFILLLHPVAGQTPIGAKESPELNRRLKRHNPSELATLTVPAQLNEGDLTGALATISLKKATNRPLVFSLSALPAGQLNFPATVTIPARRKSATFNITPVDDTRIEGNVYVTVTAAAPETGTISAMTAMGDNEPQNLFLSLPTALGEGSSGIGTVRVDRAMATPITVTMTALDPLRLNVPATVTIPAQSTTADFMINAVDNTAIEGDLSTSISAEVPGIPRVGLGLTIRDNDLRVLHLSIPASIPEGSNGSGTVLLEGTLATPLTVMLASDTPGSLIVPGSVTIPAGSSSAAFDLTASDNALVDGNRTVFLTASADTFASASHSIIVVDDEKSLRLILPDVIAEGEFRTGTVSLSQTFPDPVIVHLTSNNDADLTVPSSVSVPAGARSATFTMTAQDNQIVDGLRQRTITASADGFFGATGSIKVFDNEPLVSISCPVLLQEGWRVSGTVSIPASLPGDLVVTLTSDNPEALAVPSMVTIPSASRSANFDINAVDNSMRDGTRTATITAAADQYQATTEKVTIRDNEIAGYQFGPLSDIVRVNGPVAISVRPVDIEGNQIGDVSANVNLSLILPDGTTLPVTPGAISLTGGAFNGSVILPDTFATPLQLRVTDADGMTGDSTLFDPMHMIYLQTSDLVWDPARSRIYASLPASATPPYANKVVAIDPALMGLTDEADVNDPSQLALTSAGDALYAVINGQTGIAQINPTWMTVNSSFPIGSDFYYGMLHAGDICTVAGQRDTILVSQYGEGRTTFTGVAAYDNGIVRPNKTSISSPTHVIEPSADPTVFFGLNTASTDFSFRKLRLGATGVTEIGMNMNVGDGLTDIRSDGDKVFTNSGLAIDGPQMNRVGSFGASGLVRPESATGRVYFLEAQYKFATDYGKISAYNAQTFANFRRLSLPSVMSYASAFIRFGSNGLAFRTPAAIVLINSSQLVPSDPPADLRVSVDAPNPTRLGDQLTYNITISNLGPNIARNATLTATFSGSQSIQNVLSTGGASSIMGSVVTVTAGNVAPGGVVNVAITTAPDSAGPVWCAASVSSTSLDPNYINNDALKLISVVSPLGPDSVNQIRLPANNLIYDPDRKVLWATIPISAGAPLGGSLFAIDPNTGAFSDPIQLNADPRAGSIALSPNERYLYVGLNSAPQVERLDLNSSSYSSVRVPLITSFGNSEWAKDIEVLDGDGTSFLIVGASGHSVTVYDGTTARPNRTSTYTADRIEKTVFSDVFVGYDNYTSGFNVRTFVVSPSGVVVDQSVPGLISGFDVDIRSAGDLLLSSSGRLIDSESLTLRNDFGFSGRPCLDELNGRAYLVNGNALRGFDTVSNSSIGVFPLPVTWAGDWAQTCVRWGADGFAILGNDGRLYLLRWSAAAQ